MPVLKFTSRLVPLLLRGACFAIVLLASTGSSFADLTQKQITKIPICEADCRTTSKACLNKVIRTQKEAFAMDVDQPKNINATAEYQRTKCLATLKACVPACTPACDDCDNRYDKCLKKGFKDGLWNTDGGLGAANLRIACDKAKKDCNICAAQ